MKSRFHRLALCLLLSVFPLLLEAQGFLKTFGLPAVDEGGGVIIASPDGNFFVGGNKGDSAMILKMDPLGNVLWTKTFLPVTNSGYVNHIYDLAITPDNYLVGCGHAIYLSPFDEKGFYFKFDLGGNLQWCKYVVDTRRNYCQRLMPKSATEYLLMGNIYEMSSPTGPDVITARIDAATGNMLWMSDRYNYMQLNAFIDDVSYAVFGRNNAVYSTGRIYINGSANGGMRPYLSKFDNNGNLLFSNYLLYSASMTGRIYGQGILYDNDSLAIMYMGDLNGISTNYTIGLMRVDTLGNVAWAKDYDIPGSVAEMSSTVMRIPTGYLIYGTTNITSSLNSRDIFMISVDLNGNVLWSKTYGSSTTGEGTRIGGTPAACVAGNAVYFTGIQITNNVNTDVLIGAVDFSGNMICLPNTNFTPVVSIDPTHTTPCVHTFPADTLVLANMLPTAFTSFSDPCTAYQVDLGNDTTICAPLTLNGTIPGATAYLWQSGATSATESAATAGTYWVQVTVNCCIISDTIQVTLGNGPTAQFSAAVPPCYTQPVTFTNASSNAVTYAWDFGDNTSSTTQNPSHVYAPGTYTVTLIAASACGSDTITQVVTIDPPATVSFTLENAQGCGPLQVNFIDLSTTANGTITGWSWDFGDGNTSTLANPQHTYTTPGTYDVTLTVTTSNGCTATFAGAAAVTVYATPVAAFSSQPVQADNPGAIFTDQSTGAVTWLWSFGDGDSTTIQNPQHAYPGPGSYPVTLVVTNSYGCIDSVTALLELEDAFAFYVPNAFTPNGNGNNEGFTGYGVGIAEFHMMVFDRWGMLLYETHDMHAPWDGTYKGNKVQEDVYVYKIGITDVFRQEHYYTGHVTVVR